jgi:raffinose/stachyose/melibiose transport system permease protein
MAQSADTLSQSGPVGGRRGGTSGGAKPGLPPGYIPARRRSLLVRMRDAWLLYLALLPTLGLIAVFAYWPTINGVIQSFYNSTNTEANVFVGWDNYTLLFGDTVYWNAFEVAIKYFVFGITVGWVIPFVAAEMLVSLSSRRLQYILRTALILPMAFPATVFGFVWSFMYDPNVGVINSFLRGVGLGGLSQNWLGDPSTALYSLMAIGFPISFISSGVLGGLPFLLFLSGLQSISSEVLEAAEIDGCGRLRRVFAIDIHLLGSQFSLLFLLAMIGLTQVGSITLLLVTNGGPAYATMTPLVWLIQSGISAGNFGYGAAMGEVLFVVSVVLSASFLGIQRARLRF